MFASVKSDGLVHAVLPFPLDNVRLALLSVEGCISLAVSADTGTRHVINMVSGFRLCQARYQFERDRLVVQLR
jgi:hypothetical protein